MFYRRHLPHWIPPDAILFLTWRLAGSLPGQDHLGPVWLKDTRIATILVNAIHYGESTHMFYRLYAWVVMPNHVHVILQPRIKLPALTRWLKGRTSRTANRMLGRTGKAFWQDESFDHWIRCDHDLNELIDYVENNPVKAGLVQVAEEWPWSSATRQTTKGDRLPYLQLSRERRR